MLDIFISSETERFIRSVEKNKTILLIGSDANRHAVNTIRYYDSSKTVLSDYGDCELSESFSVAQEFGARYIFLLNIRDKYDYLDLIGILKQYDFAYIVPLNLLMSDYLYDANRENKKIYYIRDYMERASMFNHSTIILTDRHASLYENLDAFLKDMAHCVSIGRTSVSSAGFGNNLVFVANNLKRYKMGNVVLAAALAASNEGEYPSIKKTPVVFDIDSFDIGEAEMVYFKLSDVAGTTIENLVNFNKETNVIKSVYVDRIVKYIVRTIDISASNGKPYSTYLKVRTERLLESYFDSILNVMIRDYTIDSIKFIAENTGVGVIECDVTIWPKSTVGKYTISIGG